MNTEDADGPLAGSRPALADSQMPPPSRSRFGLQPILALAVGCGVLWWIVHTVSSNNHGTNEAIRAMRSWNASERVSGIERLETAGLGNGQLAIPPLIVALGDEDAQVRSKAAMALGSIGTDALKAGSLDDMVRGAITSLLGALKDPQPSVRVAAANALASIISSEKSAGLIDHKTVLVTLTESLSDRDAAVRYAALGPLALVAPASGVDPPQELADALKDESAGTRASAVVALINFGRGLDPWIPSLLQMIEKDKDPAFRRGLHRRTVASIHPPAVSAAVIPTLIAALRSPDGQVRDMACRVLMTFGSEALRGGPRPDRNGAGRVERFRRGGSSGPGSGPIGHPGAVEDCAQDRVGRPGHRGLDRAHSREVPESFARRRSRPWVKSGRPPNRRSRR